MKVKKRIAQLLSFLMIFSLVMGNSNLQVNATGETYTVDFGTGSWTVGGVEVKADKNGIQNSFADNTEITLTGFDAETMEVKLSGAEGFSTTLTVTDDKTSLSAREGSGGLPDGTLTFSVVAKSSGGAGTTTYSVNFGEGSWTVGNVTVTADKSGTQQLSETDEISLTGFNAATMEVKLTATGGFSTTLTVDESGKTSLSARGGNGGLPNETMTLSVEEKSSGGGGNTGLTDPVTISVNVITGNDYLDTFGNNLKVDGVDVVNGRVTVEKAATHVISVLPAYGMAIQKTEINGTEVAGRESEGWVSYTVDEVESKSYTISILEAKRYIYTVIWSYGESTAEDAKVSNGTVKIISAVLPDGMSGFVGVNSQDETGGHYSIVPGSTVTVEIKPDYGYQFVTGSLNGQTVTAGTEVSTFTFTMPETNLHLSALFTKTEDIINADSTQVTSGNLANGANVVDSGNLKLNIGDLTETEINSIKDEMEETAGDDEIQLYLDMDLYNVVNKGTSKDAWENKLTNLDGDLSVTLTLSEELKGKDGTFYVIREHEEENGSKSYTKIQASYDQEAGTITFATNKFSTYALVLEPPVHDPIPELVVYHDISNKEGTADVAAHLSKYDSSLSVRSYSIGAIDSGSILTGTPTVTEGKVSYTLSNTANPEESATIPVTIKSDGFQDFVLNVKIVAKKMTTVPVTVTDDGNSTGNGTVTASVKRDEAAPITTLANLTVTKIKDILQITDSTSATLYLEVQNADATVPVADKTKVTGKVTSDIPGGIVGRYLDLTLYKQVGGSAVEQMTDTGTQLLQVKVQLPDELKNTDSTKNRTYYIVRVHEGHATVLPVTFDGTNLIFSTNQFSTYAIIYKDTPKTTGGTSGSSTSGSSSSSSVKSNPVQKVAATTGDSTPVGMYVILLLTSVAVLVYLGRKKFKESK